MMFSVLSSVSNECEMKKLLKTRILRGKKGINTRTINLDYLKKSLRKNLCKSTNTFKKITNENIQFLVRIRCYRGLKHKNNYHIKKQKTHTNAKKK